MRARTSGSRTGRSRPAPGRSSGRAGRGPWRLRCSAIRIGRGEEVADIAPDTVFERGERLPVFGGAQTLHARFGEVLVAAPERRRHGDIVDGRRAGMRTSLKLRN